MNLKNLKNGNRNYAFLLLLIIGLVLISGCTGEGDICSNGKYSTEDYSISTYKPYIGLDVESKKKLTTALESEGDSALQGIADLTCLESLDLKGTEVSDISPLSGLTNLKSLKLYSTEVSDISPLSGLTGLESLDLGGTIVSDISPLSGLTNLDYLVLSSTKVSDVSPLSGLTDLTYLYLLFTEVSEEDCEALKQDLPYTTIKC